MASPHVAGAAALYLADFPAATPAEVKAELIRTREAIHLTNDGDSTDEGVVRAADLFAPPPPPPPGPTLDTAPVGDPSQSPAPTKDKKKKKKKGKGKGKKKR